MKRHSSSLCFKAINKVDGPHSQYQGDLKIKDKVNNVTFLLCLNDTAHSLRLSEIQRSNQTFKVGQTQDSGTIPGDGIMKENGDLKSWRFSLPAAPCEI